MTYEEAIRYLEMKFKKARPTQNLSIPAYIVYTILEEQKKIEKARAIKQAWEDFADRVNNS